MIYFRAAVSALGAAGLLTKLLVGAGMVAALLTAYGVWHHKVYKSGVDAAIAGIAREDAGWIKRGRDARNKLVECKEAGHGWDQTTGRCL